MLRNIGTRCYVPGCKKSSGANPELTFHRPRDGDTKRKWEAAVASRYPANKKFRVPHICSSHFVDDAYVETDTLQFRFGVVPKRKRLKPDAVPTVFPEQVESVDSHDKVQLSSIESARSEAGEVASTSGASARPVQKYVTSTTAPERVLVLNELPLKPLVQYRTVDYYAYLYALVPSKPNFEAGKMVHKTTQTAVPTATLGTQTHIHMRSRASQTSSTFSAKSTFSFAPSELMTECPENSKELHFSTWGLGCHSWIYMPT
ncbi:uncharacterized protein LOC135395470 isoform X2 [Ornithodoros turicata]|uniref:uncharacterized protein LOC135395470 isoform X2 n=1 Tax=Ornithodoros turicata TaxID=34597 RepID=UPI0031387F63